MLLFPRVHFEMGLLLPDVLGHQVMSGPFSQTGEQPVNRSWTRPEDGRTDAGYWVARPHGY